MTSALVAHPGWQWEPGEDELVGGEIVFVIFFFPPGREDEISTTAVLAGCLVRLLSSCEDGGMGVLFEAGLEIWLAGACFVF